MLLWTPLYSYKIEGKTTISHIFLLSLPPFSCGWEFMDHLSGFKQEELAFVCVPSFVPMYCKAEVIPVEASFFTLTSFLLWVYPQYRGAWGGNKSPPTLSCTVCVQKGLRKQEPEEFDIGLQHPKSKIWIEQIFGCTVLFKTSLACNYEKFCTFIHKCLYRKMFA